MIFSGFAGSVASLDIILEIKTPGKPNPVHIFGPRMARNQVAPQTERLTPCSRIRRYIGRREKKRKEKRGWRKERFARVRLSSTEQRRLRLLKMLYLQLIQGPPAPPLLEHHFGCFHIAFDIKSPVHTCASIQSIVQTP